MYFRARLALASFFEADETTVVASSSELRVGEHERVGDHRHLRAGLAPRRRRAHRRPRDVHRVPLVHDDVRSPRVGAVSRVEPRLRRAPPRAEERPVRKLGERLRARSVAAPERLRRRAPPVPAEALSGRHPERRGVQELAGPALRLRRAVRRRALGVVAPLRRRARVGELNRATRQSRQVHPGARLLRLGAERRVG